MPLTAWEWANSRRCGGTGVGAEGGEGVEREGGPLPSGLGEDLRIAGPRGGTQVHAGAQKGAAHLKKQ